VSTTEELLGNSSSLENREYGLEDPFLLPHDNLHQQKLALTSPTSGGRSVSIVRSRTKVTEFSLLLVRMSTGISEERITSIFRVENQPSKKTAFRRHLGIAKCRSKYQLHSTIFQKMAKLNTACLKHFYGALLLESNAKHHLIIKKFLGFIFNIQWNLKSKYLSLHSLPKNVLTNY
jgi:hypothetical protein